MLEWPMGSARNNTDILLSHVIVNSYINFRSSEVLL